MTNEQKMLEVFDKINSAQKVYSGRDHVCRCGCAGKYYYRDHKLFRSIIGKAIRKITEGNELEVTDQYINVSYGDDRAYTIYFLA